MKKLLDKELIMYVIVGVLTTGVSIGSYVLFARVMSMHYMVASVLSWILAVLFAFVANKRYVFNHKSTHMKELFQQLIQFVSMRGVSLLIDLAMMFILVDLARVNDIVSKVIVNVVVLLLNYGFSKWVIFKK